MTYQHNNNPVEHTSQEIDNESYNDQYKIREGAIYIYQASTDSFVPAQADSSGNLLTSGGGSGAVTNDGTFAKETGGNLATIVTNTGNSATSAKQSDGSQKTQVVDGSGNVSSVVADNADSIAPSATVNKLSIVNRGMIFNDNANTWDRQKAARASLNTSGVGIAAAGMVAAFDDVSPTAITENNLGTVRMSASRELYNVPHPVVGTALNNYSTRITTNTTTTPTSSTAYISSIVIVVETAGTTSTVDIRDKSGTPIYIVRSLATGAILGNGDLVYNFQTPIKATGGMDIITAGAAAATLGVFINYYQ